MKLAIMQPYVFPYIGYFQLINSVDKFVILDDVNFITKGWINRNRILINGKAHKFSVPVKKISQNRRICDCELADPDWGLKFIKTLEFSYKNAPHFINEFETIKTIILSKEINLADWLAFQLEILCKYFGIGTEIIKTSRIYNNLNLKGQEKIIDICKQEKATVYINPIGGKELYHSLEFRKVKCKLKFLKPSADEYKQFGNQFIPFLSIIDVMMFNDKNNIEDFLNNYELYD